MTDSRLIPVHDDQIDGSRGFIYMAEKKVQHLLHIEVLENIESILYILLSNLVRIPCMDSPGDKFPDSAARAKFLPRGILVGGARVLRDIWELAVCVEWFDKGMLPFCK